MKTVKALNVLVYLCMFAQTETILNCVVKVSGRKVDPVTGFPDRRYS